MQQHAEAVDRAQPPRPGLRQKRRFERHVDDVGDDAVGIELRKVDLQRAGTIKPDRRGIDQHGRLACAARPLRPVVNLHPRPEQLRQRLGACARPIEHAHLWHARFQKPIDDSAGCAACPQDAHRRIPVPTRRRKLQMGHKAVGVGVGRTQLIPVEPQRIGGADRARGRVRLVGRRKCRLLVRHGYVAADEVLGCERRRGTPSPPPAAPPPWCRRHRCRTS